MAPIKQVNDILESIATIHASKNEDYSSGSPFESFERAIQLIGWFKNDYDKSFVNMIATKLARLSTLLGKEGAPNNESIDDSFLDLATYCILWASYHRMRQAKNPINYGKVEEATIREKKV